MLPAAGWNDGNTDFKWKFRIRKFLPILAPAAEGGSKRASECNACERGRYIRAIIDVLIEQTALARWTAGLADKFDRINFDQECCGAAILCCFRIENMRLAEGESHGMKLSGTFVKQVAQISGWPVGCGDGQVHKRQLYREQRQEVKLRSL